MKNIATRFWNGLFPIPAVSVIEAFLLRALLAGVLFWFFPPSLQIQSQPEPVGLAHWFDLTWLSGAGVFPIYRAVFFGLLVLYTAGFVLPVTLPLLTLMHILPATLHNSQGFTFHGNQIMSLTLVGLSIMTLYFLVRQGMGSPRKLGIPGLIVPFVVLIEAALVWNCEKEFVIVALGWRICPDASPFLIGWCNVAAFLVVFAAAVGIPATLARAWKEVGAPSAVVRSWSLVTAQFVIACAYLISVFSKFIRSKGEWLVNSHYVALDFVKTLRQTYYSSLDPQYAVDPPAYIVTMLQHPVITAFFFDFGVALEAVMIFAVGCRKWTFVVGASLIFMHITIANIMNLFFPTHVAMLAVFWVAPLLLVRLPGCRDEKERPA